MDAETPMKKRGLYKYKVELIGARLNVKVGKRMEKEYTGFK